MFPVAPPLQLSAVDVEHGQMSFWAPSYVEWPLERVDNPWVEMRRYDPNGPAEWAAALRIVQNMPPQPSLLNSTRSLMDKAVELLLTVGVSALERLKSQLFKLQ